MKVYSGSELRNVALVGHLHAGKTQLTSALLFTTGAINRLTRVDDGSAPTDFDEEEHARKLSVQAAIAPMEWNKCKLNVVDTPGFHMFLHETKGALVAADSAIVVVDGVAGVEVQTEKTWSFCDELNLPRAIFINKMDRERASFPEALESVRNSFGRTAIPLQLPIGEEREFSGVIDLITMKAYSQRADGDGKGRVISIPPHMAEEAKVAHEVLVEMVAEGNDALLEEFFSVGTLPIEHIIDGLKQAVQDRRIFPVLLGSALHNFGTGLLLDYLTQIAPSPADRPAALGAVNGAEMERLIADDQPLSVFVFKTMADPFAGRISFFRVMSGVLKEDMHLCNGITNADERFAHIGAPLGKTMLPVPQLHAGDIGAVAKLKDTLTGHTLYDKASPILFAPVSLPEPSIAYAIAAKSRNDEDKVGVAMHKIMEEDQCLRFDRDMQTKEFLLHGTGQQHIEVVVSRLHRRYHVDVTLSAPKVPYRETIRGAASVQGRHKKQTGGHGQFGDCWIRMEPLQRGEGFAFANEVFGGAVPRQYIPAIEKGILETAERGYLAGYPMVDFKVTVFDGSYHDVDSSEMAFKQAARKAFRAAMEVAKPALLEPLMRVEVQAPVEYAGDLISNFNGRRGRVTGMDTRGGTQVIRAVVPMAEMLTYQNDLTALTQGRGSYSMEFESYDYVPTQQVEKIVAAGKASGVAVHDDED